MCLIRLAGHFINNPNHIDKLICIKGLPEEWIFRPSKFGGKELVHPWKPDVDANIPESIRHLCEPTEVTIVFPPIEKGKESVVDKIMVLGIKFDYMTEPGQVLWEKIERYLDRMTPRDQRIPVPVLVAPDQKSQFNPHMPRRTPRGSLELIPSDIPVVDLRIPVIETVSASAPVSTAVLVAPVTPVVSVPAPIVEEKKAEVFKCEKCDKVFDKKRALFMHDVRGHKKEVAKV